MKFFNIIFLIIFLSIDIKAENNLSFSIDYNSLLYEFEGTKENSFYYNLEFNGKIKIKKGKLYYDFSYLYPFSYSLKERKPLKIGIVNINYNNSFCYSKNKKYEFSLFLNFKKAEDYKFKVPVEEETYNLYGMDNSLDLFSNLKFKFGFRALQTKNYEIFQNKKFYFSFKFSKELNENLKFTTDLNFSKYYFDKKILDLTQVPFPILKEHKENVFSFDLGFEYFSYYILSFIIFFQKKDATIEDLSNKSFGFEGFISLNLKENLNMVISMRIEKRFLNKKYLFFEPNILTEIGTSYIYIKFIKNITKRNNLGLTLGRFVHDAREDFFKTDIARYKITISFNHIL